MRKILALAALAIFGLAACGDGAKTPTSESADSTQTPVREVSDDVAYVNLDSLMTRYDMFLELSKALEDKATKVQNEIASRARSLERAVASAQEKMEKNLVTRAEGAELQEKLQRQEQGFYDFRDKAQAEFNEENVVMMNKISHNLNEFVKKFNSDYRYKMIITTSNGTPILHADPQLDITDVVIKGLNEEYAAVKKQDTKNK